MERAEEDESAYKRPSDYERTSELFPQIRSLERCLFQPPIALRSSQPSPELS